MVSAAQAGFNAQVERGICIICGKPAQVGTRYCGGDGGCPVTHNAAGEECLVP